MCYGGPGAGDERGVHGDGAASHQQQSQLEELQLCPVCKGNLSEYSSRIGTEASRDSTKETGWGVKDGLEESAAWEALP